ncbi:MAG: hypothetical protein U0931_05050 [Vulcanimicrobiota bacterium]
MTTSTQTPPWTHKKETPPASVRRQPAESDEEGLLVIARYLLKSDHASSDEREKAMRQSPALRRYLSGVNLADDCWIWDPLLRDIDTEFSNWPPHQLGLRTEELRTEFPDPTENEESRLGIAVGLLFEAVEALHSFVRESEWEGKRLNWRVATAIRAEIRSLLAYIDASCPREFGGSDKYDYAAAAKTVADEEPESARLRADQPLTDEFLLADIEKASHATRGLTNQDYDSPAELLAALVKLSRFVVVPRRQSAPFEVCRLQNQVPIAGHRPALGAIYLDKRLDEVHQNVALAQALAYVRLHQNHVKELQPSHLAEQERYAELFLLPAPALEEFCRSLPLEFTRRWILRAICKQFKVPEELAAVRLAEVGLRVLAA